MERWLHPATTHSELTHSARPRDRIAVQNGQSRQSGAGPHLPRVDCRCSPRCFPCIH